MFEKNIPNIEDLIRIEKQRPDRYVLFPTNSIYFKKENYHKGDKINLVSICPFVVVKSADGDFEIIEMYANLIETIIKVVVKNKSGQLFSHIIH